MSPALQNLLTAIFLASGLFLLTGCIPDFDASTKPLAVEASPPPPVPHEGPPLFCKAGRGSAHAGHNNWYEFTDIAFMLYQNERVNIPLSPLAGHSPALTVQSFFDHDGQKIVFCPMIDAPPGQPIACASLYVLDDDLHAGIKRTLDIPNALRGGAVSCAYQQVNLKKLTSYAGGGN